MSNCLIKYFFKAPCLKRILTLNHQLHQLSEFQFLYDFFYKLQ